MVGVKIECEGVKAMFVVVDGFRIARRGYPVRRRLGLGFHLSPDGKSLTTGAGTQSLSNTMASASIKGQTLFGGALILGLEQVLVPLNVLLMGS